MHQRVMLEPKLEVLEVLEEAIAGSLVEMQMELALKGPASLPPLPMGAILIPMSSASGSSGITLY